MSQQIAVFPLANPLLPDGRLPLRVFETRYLDLVRRNMKGEQEFAIALLASGGEVAKLGAKPAQAYPLATLARVIDFQQGSDGCLHLLLHGEQKVELSEFEYQADGLLLARANTCEEQSEALEQEPVLSDLQLELLHNLAEQLLAHPALQNLQLTPPIEQGALAALLAQYLPFEPQVKYSLLSLESSLQRLSKIVTLVDDLS